MDAHVYTSSRLSFVHICDGLRSQLCETVLDPQVRVNYDLRGGVEARNKRLFSNMENAETPKQGTPYTVAGVCLNEPTTLIGAFSLTNDVVSYLVLPKFWNHGYGTEILSAACSIASERFNLSRLTAYVLRTNVASIKILEAQQFVFSGLEVLPVGPNSHMRSVLKYSLRLL
jgi:RimJ/RimL family protein N-acetyltransferase